MTTRWIVPRADLEGSIGEKEKRWAELYVGKINGSAWENVADKANLAELKTQGYVLPQMFKTNDNTWTEAVQSAVNSGKNVLFPEGVYELTDTIILPAEVIISGVNKTKCIIRSSADVAFKYQAPAGSVEYVAPCFHELTLFCNSGIQYNDEAKDCVDGANAEQGYVMRPYISNMIIRANQNKQAGTIGIHCTKCFNGVIEKCKIYDFDKAIKFYGTDNSSIHDNRVYGCNILLDIESRNSFGSQTWIYNNDLMAFSQYGIKSSARSIYINHNYFEEYSENAIFTYVYGGFSVEMCSNKVDNSSYTAKLVSITTTLYNINICENFSTGDSFPQIVFENDNSRNCEINGSMYKKSVRIKDNCMGIDFERHISNKNESELDTSVMYPMYATFFNIHNIVGSPLSTYGLCLFDYKNEALELKANGGIANSVYGFPIMCKGKRVKITIKAKTKNAESSSLFYQTRSEWQSGVMTSNTITLDNDWKEYVLVADTSSTQYLVLANDNATDTEDTRPLIKWIKCEYV